jgi:hypothetical protein
VAKKGRKAVLKGEYERLTAAFKALGEDPPSLRDYERTPPRVREALKRLLQVHGNPSGVKLPSRFTVTGEWVACVVHPDGKSVSISGENLRVEEGGGVCV